MPATLQLFESIIDQAETVQTSSKGRQNLKPWIEKNVSHPRDPSRGWSWDGHEYQIQLVTDLHPQVAVQKCAQVGVSELFVNVALGLLSVLPNSNLIYSLQTAAYASKFMTTRIDAAIEKSRRLQVLLDKDVDSSQLKKIASSYLHVVGAHSENQAISVPCSAVINDEISFCNPSVIGAFMSRLEHLPEEEKTLFQFSTPLYTGMGITDVFEHGTQHVYMCYHTACGKWVPVNPTTDLVIPGFDKQLQELTPADLASGSLDVDRTYVKCSHCSQEITRENLADPTYRQWVPTFQERVGRLGTAHSYQVFPTDVAAIKSPAQIVRSLSLYKRADRFFQYGLGVPFDSAESMILPGRLEQAFSAPMVDPSSGERVPGSVIGVDVGKTSHAMMGKRIDGKLHIFWAEKIVQTGEGALQSTIYQRFVDLSAVKAVIDQAPDFSSVKSLQGMLPIDSTWGAYFTRGGQNKLAAYELREREGLVAISRTRMIDDFVKEFNNGNILLPRGTKHKDEIIKNFMNLKRIDDMTATGEDVSKWIAVSPETHFMFAAIYLFTASKMVEDSFAGIILPGSAAGLIGKVRMKVAA